MDESYAIRRYEQAAALLPLRWQQQARQLAPEQMARAEELRLRAGGPMTVLLPEGEITPGQGGQSPTERRACFASIDAGTKVVITNAETQIRRLIQD